MDLQINPDQSYEAIVDAVDQLLAINSENLDAEAIRQSKIFTQLNKLYRFHSVKLKKLIDQQAQVKHLRWKHYTGKMPSEHYKTDPLPVAVLKQDLDQHLAIDPQVIEMAHIVHEQNLLVKYLEDAMAERKQRSWDIKNAIEFRKFLAGSA